MVTQTQDSPSVRDVLLEENRILREGLEEILRYRPHFAYASASSHPDTNQAHQHLYLAERALKAAAQVASQSAGGSE